MRSTLRTGALALAALAGLWGCDNANLAAPAEARLNDADRVVLGTETDVHEAALRYLFANKADQTVDAFCVSTGFPEADNDPSQSLLDRFLGNTPPVVPLSSCTIAVTGDTYNPTGGRAQWFFVGPATINARNATVGAGFHLNGRLRETFDCSLRYTTQWTVTNCTLVSAA